MAAFRGERFHVDLGSDEEDEAPRTRQAPSLIPGFVKDIREKPTSTFNKPPVAPIGATPTNGFPAHKKRFVASKFKQERAAHTDTSLTPSPPASVQSNVPPSFEENERQQIDKENRERLAHMSEEDILKEKQELIQGLPLSLVQRLLSRAVINSPPTEFSYPDPEPEHAEIHGGTMGKEDVITTSDNSPAPERNRRVAFEIPETDAQKPLNQPIPSPTSTLQEPVPSMHFPSPKQPPSLDPNSSTFLTDLHEKYFPDLVADPSKLAWMSEPSMAEMDSYSTAMDSLPVSALRFSFAGALLPPSVSASIPTTAGLHHHGDAPAAAGYTIAELAHLARSSFPSQRCIAFQTLGRLLYRLGKGEFGRGEEGAEVERGLWACVREGRVLETLQEEAGRKSGHVSAIAYAVDALWLWQKGGGKEPREFNAA